MKIRHPKLFQGEYLFPVGSSYLVVNKYWGALSPREYLLTVTPNILTETPYMESLCTRQVYMVKRSKTKKLTFIVSNLCIWCKTIIFPLISLRKLSYNIEETCASYFNKETGSSCIYYPQCDLCYHDRSCKTKLFELNSRERGSAWLVTAPFFIVFVVFIF